MSPLIPMQEHLIGGVLQQSVNARDLWAFLRPRNTIANWMSNKLIQHHRFAENEDYVRLKVLREIKYGSHVRISHQVDYLMTVTMAQTIGAAEFCRGPIAWK